MVTIDKTLTIRAPREAVFRLLVERSPDWVPRAFGGAHFDCRPSPPALEPMRRFAWRQEVGDFTRAEGEFVLEDVPDGTRVHLRALVEPPFVLPRVATDSSLERELSHLYDGDLLRLKRRLET